MEILINTFLVVASVVILILIVKPKTVSKKTAPKQAKIKKSELKQKYIDEVKTSLNGLGKNSRIEKKQKLLLQINQELSQNIFFTKEEARDFIVELSQL